MLVAMLMEAGCRIAALDVPASLSAIADDWPDAITRIPLDATKENEVEGAFARVAEDGALDGLVNLAGFTRERCSVAKTQHAAWQEVIDVNLDSAFLCARAAMPLLRDGRDAAMVLTSSGLALKPTPGYGPYAAAKAGVLALTRILAAENAPHVRVNAVAPSAVETTFLTGGTGRARRKSSFDKDAYLATVPLARMAKPIDVVEPVLFLLGPASSYITGQTLHVNGGLIMP